MLSSKNGDKTGNIENTDDSFHPDADPFAFMNTPPKQSPMSLTSDFFKIADFDFLNCKTNDDNNNNDNDSFVDSFGDSRIALRILDICSTSLPLDPFTLIWGSELRFWLSDDPVEDLLNWSADNMNPDVNACCVIAQTPELISHQEAIFQALIAQPQPTIFAVAYIHQSYQELGQSDHTPDLSVSVISNKPAFKDFMRTMLIIDQKLDASEHQNTRFTLQEMYAIMEHPFLAKLPERVQRLATQSTSCTWADFKAVIERCRTENNGVERKNQITHASGLVLTPQKKKRPINENIDNNANPVAATADKKKKRKKQ